MSTQSDYSGMRVAGMLLASVLLTAGTVRQVAADETAGKSDIVTKNGIPAPLNAIAAQNGSVAADEAGDIVPANGPDLPPAKGNPVAGPAPLPGIRQSGFVYCVSGVVNTFNPQMASSGVTVDTLSAQLYDRLLAVDPYTYRLIPELAQRWEVLDNGATYRFHLRKNIAFQHTAWFTPTRTLNADDVVFSFARMFDTHHPWHGVNGGNYPYFDSLQFPQTVQSVKRIDNETVEFRLESPDASFLWHLATHYAPVLSAEYADQLTASGHQEQLDRMPVGTGPFMLNEYHTGSSYGLAVINTIGVVCRAWRKWLLI